MSPRRPLRALASAAALAAVATTLTGCFVLGACPAIGWMNGATLDSRAYPGVAEVQFCVELQCSPRSGEEETTSMTTLFAVSPGEEAGEWGLMFDMSAPETVLIRLFDAEGTLIRESEESISWTFSDEPCGGPARAEPIVLA